MGKATTYGDFVGARLQIEVQPFEFMSARAALTSALWKRIRNELTYENGLVCAFTNVETKVDKGIFVSGTVIQCEVDC